MKMKNDRKTGIGEKASASLISFMMIEGEESLWVCLIFWGKMVLVLSQMLLYLCSLRREKENRCMVYIRKRY